MGVVGKRLVGAVAMTAMLCGMPVWAQEQDSAKLCDQLAASPYDPAVAAGSGVGLFDIDTNAAISACQAAVAAAPDDLQAIFQLARANDAANNLEVAAEGYKSAADQGYLPAVNSLGSLYDGGYGVPDDPAEAARLYQRAVDGGLVIAMENLGKLYEEGRGVEQDYGRARSLYQQAADAGSAFGSGSLGWLSENGFGVPKDLVEAARLYRIAADGGEAFAQHNLGYMYAHGLGGLPQDDAESVKYFRLAADQDWPRSLNALAWNYSHGVGVDKDLATAEDYLRRAIAGDDAEQQADAQNDLAWLFATEGVGSLEEAEALARQAVDAGPDIANRVDTLAWVLHQRGQDEEALTLARQAVALDGTDASFAQHLAAIEKSLAK